MEASRLIQTKMKEGNALDALEFIRQMQEQQRKIIRNLSAPIYFTTLEGKGMCHFIVASINIIGNNSFTIEKRRIAELEDNLLYKGRNFFADMISLGFEFNIISQPNDPLVTYLFKATTI